MIQNAIYIEELSFSYNQNPFFSSLTLAFEAGRLHGIKGANGVGKSTLFQLIKGEQPYEGKIICSGKVEAVHQKYDRMIADQFTVEENLRFASLPRRPSFFKPLRKKEHHHDPLLHPQQISVSLSGGQKQILALKMVMQRNPRILLLDEPTAALDTQNEKRVFEYIRELIHQGVTVLMICHDDRLLHTYCDGTILEIRRDQAGKRHVIPIVANKTTNR